LTTPANIQLAQGSAQTPAGGGTGPATTLLGDVGTSDAVIRGALSINPAYAADFVSGRYSIEFPVPGDNRPSEAGKAAANQMATQQGPNAWKKRTLPAMSDPVLFGNNQPQAPFKHPWNKKLIPPLALFNDAAQWVNRLMFNAPMTWFGANTSDPPLKAQYFTPPPINTNNLAAGTLNLQLQLGQMAIQAQQLTLDASIYFGGN
jgi:hypothetical protein